MASQYEISLGEQIVDVRPWTTRAAESLSDPINLIAVCTVLIFATVILPMLMPLTIICFVVVVVASKNVSGLLPLRYPPEMTDPETKKPGTGIWFLGNMSFDKKKERRLPLENVADRFKEVWLADDDLRKHMLILGSTGSGKSELLKGIFFCSLCWGSGFFVADGKADNKLPLDVYNMAMFFGRDDDLLTLNFLLAGKKPSQVQSARTRRTNKTNPFSTADGDTIVQMGANLLPKVDGDAKNWQEKALTCWRGLVPAICWLRDNEAMETSVTTYVDYLSLAKLEELYIRGHVLAQQNGGVWDEAFLGLKSYLEVGLPGFKIDRCLRKYNVLPSNSRPPPMGGKPEPTDQDATCYDQHGYRATQLNPALNLLDKTYGHIFQDKFSEVDMVDVTLNNRILALLIPSLERSAQEAESLGKLTVACLRVMMGKNLGAEIEGTRERILESKATEARYPYVVALDELGYYFADGIAVMFAQARSLGFAMIAAAQDIEKLTEGSRAAEAGAMMANQVMKIFMRIDDANKTNEMIQKYLDKVNVAVKENYEYRDTIGFKRLPEVKLTQVPIATLKNLQSLDAGSAIINSMGKTFKLASFYVGSFLQKHPTQTFHINRFLQMRSLTDKEVMEGIVLEDGTEEIISLPINVLEDAQVKGVKMKSYLTGDEPLPDLRAVADESAYSAKHDRAVGLLNAVSLAAASLPANVVGAQRAIVLYRIAREYVLSSRTDASTRGAVRTGGDAMKQQPQAPLGEPFVVIGDAYVAPSALPVQAPDEAQPQTVAEFAALAAREAAAVVAAAGVSGESIADGSGTGQGPNSFASPHDDDPLDFLNEAKPLERKATSSLMMAAPSAVPSAGLADMLKPQDASLSEAGRSSDSLPPRLTQLVQAVVASGEALDFSFAPSAPTSSAGQQASADAQWIGKALAQAATGLATKGDTVVGFTDNTKTSFVRLEAALGNAEPQQAAAAIEQLVAQQTTPTPMDPDALGADFGDINDLMREVEESIRA
jgi:hypothetical protein